MVLINFNGVSMVYLWCIWDTPLLRERNQKFLGLLHLVRIIYIVEIMNKKQPHIFDLMDRFGKPRILRAYSQRRFKNKKRVEERKTGQKSFGFKKGGINK